MSGYYILDADRALVPVVHYRDYFFWLDAERERLGQDVPRATLQVRYDTVNGHTLSTVFLGLDHNWGDDGPPLVFETMYFDGDDRQWRWSTWDEAVEGHNRLADELRDRGESPGGLPNAQSDAPEDGIRA